VSQQHTGGKGARFCHYSGKRGAGCIVVGRESGAEDRDNEKDWRSQEKICGLRDRSFPGT